MTIQEIVDAFVAGGDTKARAQEFLNGGSREAYLVLTSAEFACACLDNAEAMGIALPLIEDADLTEEQEAEIDALLTEADALEERAAQLRDKVDVIRTA